MITVIHLVVSSIMVWNQLKKEINWRRDGGGGYYIRKYKTKANKI